MKRATVIALIVLLIAGAFVSCNYDNIIDDEFNPAIDITSETITLIPGSRYRTVEDTTIADRVTIDGKGTVTIILTEGTTLTAEKGINVTDDQELHIIGEGKLVATGDEKSAGIGGGDGEDSGTIVIQGGDITANGGTGGGAGIGGGKGGKGGTVIIETLDDTDAPEVTTKGGNAGADGIGNGDGATGDPETVELDGVGLEVSADGLTWEDYDDANPHPKQYMRTFVGATITFNANGGTGDMAAQTIHINKATALKPNTFTKEGEIFKGWNTKADGSGDDYADKASIEISADITLYAQWEVAPTGNYITAETTTIQSGLTWTIQDNVVNLNKIVIDGTEETSIILPEGLKLEVKLGIAVSSGQTLIIDGTGELVAGEGLIGGSQGQAGIGGAHQYDYGGTIIIRGGIVTAYGGWYTSGIGCINYPEGEPPAEGTLNIKIYGGVVTSTGDAAAGIGGYKASILIEDGEVHAQTTGTGAGIGGYGCSITINGGTIEAVGEKEGAGIGSNNYMYGDDPHHDITITGGTITAIGGSCDWGAGAGIGGGYYGASGTITISGGSITATGGYSVDYSAAADGIGRGSGSGARDITVSGVTLFVSEDGIGWSPYAGTPRQYMKTDNVTLYYITTTTASLEAGKTYTIAGDVTNNNRITISGAVTISLPAERKLTLSKGITVAEGQTLTITGDSTGELLVKGEGPDLSAGIGSEKNYASGNIIINGGLINATGCPGGAGIGGGRFGSCNVTINGGTVNATGGDKVNVLGNWYSGGAGIGVGERGTSVTVNITGGDITATGRGGGAGIGGASDWAPDITTFIINISGGRITATGSRATVGTIDESAAGIGGGFAQPCNSTGAGSMTITLSGSPQIKASAGEKSEGSEIYRNAWGIGRGNRNNSSIEEANLDVSGLDAAAKLRVSATDTDDYVDFNGSNRMRYMKTANYVEPEP